MQPFGRVLQHHVMHIHPGTLVLEGGMRPSGHALHNHVCLALRAVDRRFKVQDVV